MNDRSYIFKKVQFFFLSYLYIFFTKYSVEYTKLDHFFKISFLPFEMNIFLLLTNGYELASSFSFEKYIVKLFVLFLAIQFFYSHTDWMNFIRGSRKREKPFVKLLKTKQFLNVPQFDQS